MSKLVRDKIPEIIAKTNKSAKVKIIKNDFEYLTALNNKLLEEVNEFIEASKHNDSLHQQNEIADIMEVIEAICKLKKYNHDLIQKIQAKKKLERGGFEKRIFLISKD